MGIEESEIYKEQRERLRLKVEKELKYLVYSAKKTQESRDRIMKYNVECNELCIKLGLAD